MPLFEKHGMCTEPQYMCKKGDNYTTGPFDHIMTSPNCVFKIEMGVLTPLCFLSHHWNIHTVLKYSVTGAHIYT